MHQRASLPAVSISGKQNEAFMDEAKTDSTRSDSIVDESRIEIGMRRASMDSDESRLIKKNSIKTKWGKLKRRLSIEVDHIDSVSFDDNELLPDELEYIEGGDIVHAELAHSPSYDASKHTLGTLVEEKEPKSSEQKSSEDKSNNALSLLRSRLTRTTSHDSPLLPRQASKTVETKM